MSTQPVDLQQSHLPQEPELRDYLSILDRRRWWVVIVFLLVLASTVVFSYWASPIYRASTLVEVAGPAFVFLGSPQGQTQGQTPVVVPESTNVDTMVEIMKEHEVLDRAANMAGLELAPGRGPRGIFVHRVATTDLIRIDVENPDPLHARRLANAVASATVEVNLEGRRQHFTDIRKYIEGQLDDTTQRLHSAEAAIARFRSQGGNVSLSQKTTGNIQKISELQTQRLALQLDIRSLEEEMQQDPITLPMSERGQGGATEIPTVRTLRDQLAKLEVELAGLRAQFTDKYPELRAAEARLQQTRDLLRRENSNQVASLKAQLDVLRAKDKVLSDTIEQLTGEAENIPLRELELEKLTREQKVEEGSYLFLAQKLEEARIAETSVGSQVQVASPAVVPTHPVKPNKAMNTLFGSMLGLFLGVGAAFFMEYLDDTIRTKDDIERILKTPVLGVVPSVKQQKRAQ